MSRTRWVAATALLATLAFLLSGCGATEGPGQATSSTTATATAAGGGEVLYQYATLDALMAGVYDGDLTIAELVEHGDQGLGTIDNLDGELVVLDGTAYQVAYDGSVHVLGGEVQTPFAVVTDFEPDITLTSAGPLAFDELKAAIDRLRPSANLPYAIRIEGTFVWVKTRSVPAQSRPYRPLPDVLKEQSEFEFANVAGTVTGFWLPAYMNGPNAGGYHLHFLTAERDGGGHVLDCHSGEVSIALDETGEWTAELPTDGDFTSTDLSEERYQ